MNASKFGEYRQAQNVLELDSLLRIQKMRGREKIYILPWFWPMLDRGREKAFIYFPLANLLTGMLDRGREKAFIYFPPANLLTGSVNLETLYIYAKLTKQ